MYPDHKSLSASDTLFGFDIVKSKNIIFLFSSLHLGVHTSFNGVGQLVSLSHFLQSHMISPLMLSNGVKLSIVALLSSYKRSYGTKSK